MTHPNSSELFCQFVTLIDSITPRTFEGPDQLSELRGLVGSAHESELLSPTQWDYLLTIVATKQKDYGWHVE